VNQFRLDGEDDLNRLHRETTERIGLLREQQRALETRALNTDIEAAVRAQTLDDIRARADAVDELEREWDKYLDEVAAVRSMIGHVHSKVPTLEVIRDNAASRSASCSWWPCCSSSSSTPRRSRARSTP
jgi:hypothetical protein